jgi:LysR family glycine cleavage system transcriptional activator
VFEAVRFSSMSLALAAAIQGAGVVLARSLLVHDALADRKLRRVLLAKWDMPSSKAHFVRWRTVLVGDKRVSRLLNGFQARQSGPQMPVKPHTSSA